MVEFGEGAPGVMAEEGAAEEGEGEDVEEPWRASRLRRQRLARSSPWAATRRGAETARRSVETLMLAKGRECVGDKIHNEPPK